MASPTWRRAAGVALAAVAWRLFYLRSHLDESFLEGFSRLDIPRVVPDNLGGGPSVSQRGYSARSDFRETLKRMEESLGERDWEFSISPGWPGSFFFQGKKDGPFDGFNVSVEKDMDCPNFLVASDLIVGTGARKGWTAILIIEPMERRSPLENLKRVLFHEESGP